MAVHLGLLDRFDLIARAWARPDDVWGAAQMRADFVVEGLRPAVVAGLLAAFTVACCVKRRSLETRGFVGGVCLATVALTVAVKISHGASRYPWISRKWLRRQLPIGSRDRC